MIILKVSILLLGFLFVICIVLFSKLNKKLQKSLLKENITNTRYNLFIVLLVIIALSLIIFAVFGSIEYFTGNLKVNSNVAKESVDDMYAVKGQIGDKIGGLMNPFIAISAVIVTGLAFYMQFKANKLVQDQFNLQRFEEQFYEMIRLHRANIDEMKIEGYDFVANPNITRQVMFDGLSAEKSKLHKVYKITEGRKVFVTMQTELECLFKIWLLDKSNFLSSDSMKMIYELFFNGYEWFNKKYIIDENSVLPISSLKKFKKELIAARKKHKNEYNLDRWKAHKKIQLNFNYRPFSGHSSRLAHYFRHLFLTVKFVVNESNKFLEYESKIKYLKLLRAQLSNHEQILLFYNWLGGYGAKWEDKNNNFFTDYCMIHNLWYDNLFQYEIEDGYINKAIEGLRKIKPKNRNPKESLFEMDTY
jgi:hypothetical protein